MFPYPEHRWEPWQKPTVVMQGGPDRVVRDDPAPDFKPHPVGFAPPVAEPAEAEPLLWDGDNA